MNRLSPEEAKLHDEWKTREDVRDVAEHEVGVCPVCESMACFDYRDRIELDDEEICYDWECHMCESAGREHYSVTFDRHTVTRVRGKLFDLKD